MKKLMLMIALLASLPLWAQQQPPQSDPIGENLFPPDLIMAHQEDLGLQDNQRNAIKSEVLKVQPKFMEWQWEIGEQTQKMVALLRANPIDESKVLEQADRIMSIEREIKRAHLGLLIRLKNLLSTDQIAKLNRIRKNG